VTARVVVTDAASDDQRAVLLYLHRHAGTSVARRYQHGLSELFRQISDHPDSGPMRPGLGKDIRIGILPPYIVVYRHDQDAGVVVILRILHGRRRIAGAMLGG